MTPGFDPGPLPHTGVPRRAHRSSRSSTNACMPVGTLTTWSQTFLRSATKSSSKNACCGRRHEKDSVGRTVAPRCYCTPSTTTIAFASFSSRARCFRTCWPAAEPPLCTDARARPAAPPTTSPRSVHFKTRKKRGYEVSHRGIFHLKPIKPSSGTARHGLPYCSPPHLPFSHQAFDTDELELGVKQRYQRLRGSRFHQLRRKHHPLPCRRRQPTRGEKIQTFSAMPSA